MYCTVDKHHKNVLPAVAECFATDPALLAKWHIAAPATLEECVSRTMRDVAESFDLSDFKFYRIYDKEALVGYWGVERGWYLDLIFVKPEYRQSKSMSQIWNLVKGSMPQEFGTVVYAKNTPAVQFYSKHCCENQLQKIADQDVVAFRFNKEKV